MNIFILTGSIATGKSTTLKQFKSLGFKVLNADAIGHELLNAHGAAVIQVAGIFPEVALQNQAGALTINRKKLSDLVFADATQLKLLEKILHPLVSQKMQSWLKKQRRIGVKDVVIEIPIYFEARWQKNFRQNPRIILTSASPWVAKKRALARPNMTQEKLHAILKRQWPTPRKIVHADAVIHTGLGRANALKQIKFAINQAT